MIESQKVEHSASYVVGCWWMLAAVFVSAPAPLNSAHSISIHGAPFTDNRRQQKKTRSKYTYTELETMRGQETGYKNVAWRWTNIYIGI